MKKADLKQHLETYCIYRPQTCEFCSREIALTNLQVSNILFCLFIIYNNYNYKLVLVILVDKKKKKKTGRATVCRVNRAQNSGLVNFVPKSPLPFVQ